MKKTRILSAIIFISVLLLSLTVGVSASNAIEVSEDYSTLTYKGEVYSRVDPTDIIWLNGSYETNYVFFPSSAKDEIEDAYAYVNSSAIQLWITYEKGGSCDYIYIRNDLLDNYEEFIANGGSKYTVELLYETIGVDAGDLFSKNVKMKGYELNYYSFLGYVYTKGLDGDIESSTRGYVFGDLGGSYYYVDYYQFGRDRVDDLSLCESVTVWEITDREIIADIEEYSDYVDDSFTDGNIFEDSDMFIPGLIILIAVLGLFPLAAAIVTFILSVKAKLPYRRHLRIISALCLATFIITIATVIVCIVLV